MAMYIDPNDITITLDPSVKHITKIACMALSGTIENGILLTGNPACSIVIKSDRVEFGRCMNPELQGRQGFLFPNFYKEYGDIVYRYGPNLKCSFWNKTLDYVGFMASTITAPDNEIFYDLIYPRFS